MSDVDLSGYKVTFRRNEMNVWAWEAESPDGDYLSSDVGHLKRENAEHDAYRALKRHASAETVNGEELAERFQA